MMSLQNTDHGWGTFSKEIVPEGKIIRAFDQPILQAIHSEYLSNTCDHCRRIGTNDNSMGICQGCDTMHYCSKGCQKVKRGKNTTSSNARFCDASRSKTSLMHTFDLFYEVCCYVKEVE